MEDTQPPKLVFFKSENVVKTSAALVFHTVKRTNTARGGKITCKQSQQSAENDGQKTFSRKRSPPNHGVSRSKPFEDLCHQKATGRYGLIVPCRKFGSPYPGKAQQPKEQRYPLLSVCTVFVCVQ